MKSYDYDIFGWAIVGWAIEGAIYCTDCVRDGESPVFASHEHDRAVHCDQCRVHISGRDRECIVDGCHGIYVPQRFAEKYLGIFTDLEARAILLDGPDNECYLDVWDEVLGGEHVELPDGFSLEQEDGDVFLVGPEA